MPDPDYKALCAELVVIEDAMSGGSVQLSSQGQALDGYVALAAFRYIAAKARIALAQPEPVAPTLKEVSDWILLEKKKGARWATATDHYEALPIACASMHHALARWGNSQGILDSSLQREPASEEN